QKVAYKKPIAHNPSKPMNSHSIVNRMISPLLSPSLPHPPSPHRTSEHHHPRNAPNHPSPHALPPFNPTPRISLVCACALLLPCHVPHALTNPHRACIGIHVAHGN